MNTSTSLMQTLILPIGILILLVIGYFWIIRPLLKALEDPKEKKKSAEKPLPEQEELTLPPKKMSDQEKIHRLAQSDPEKAKDLIKQWLHEDR